MDGVERVQAASAVPSRFLRAAAFAVVAVALGGLGHVTAAGEPPAVEHCALLAFAIALAAVIGLRREVGLAGILIALVALQVGLHQAFGWLHANAAPHGRLHEAALSRGDWSWRMAVAHALGVLASAWWLRRGEAAWWRRVRAAATAVVGVVRRLAGPPRHRRARGLPAAPPLPASPPSPWCLLVVAGTPRRGPPRNVAPTAA